jgi:uncharacterized membrane protein YjgN (DUF898 family)
MKNYFNFHLTGKQLLPLWLIFYVIFLLPYIALILKIQSFKTGGAVTPAFPFVLLLLIMVLIIFAMVWTVYFVKTVLQGVSLKENAIRCDYKVGKYIGVVFLGMFLSIITLGIYSPWFVRNMQRFFVDNSSYKDNKFSFQGAGGKLFVIILLTLIIPMIVVGVGMFFIFGKDISDQPQSYQIINQIVFTIILIPYMYYIYKWMVDVRYKEYHIQWDTEALPAMGKIAVEVLLSIITLGIYFPLAFIRLYKYFAEKTKGKAIDGQTIGFGYDADQMNDFLLIWGQMLLTIVTLGIYYPWAICRISQRILSKSYMEKISSI